MSKPGDNFRFYAIDGNQEEQPSIHSDKVERFECESPEMGGTILSDFNKIMKETRRIKDAMLIPKRKEPGFTLLVLHEDIRKPTDVEKKLKVYTITEKGGKYLEGLEDGKAVD